MIVPLLADCGRVSDDARYASTPVACGVDASSARGLPRVRRLQALVSRRGRKVWPVAFREAVSYRGQVLKPEVSSMTPLFVVLATRATRAGKDADPRPGG